MEVPAMKLARIVTAVICAVAVAGVVRVFAEPNTKTGSIEDQQVITKAQDVVARTKEAGKAVAENSQKAVEAASEEKPAETLGEMLSACPQDIRNEFLASIAFVNGGVASVYTGGIKKCLTPENIASLFKAMGHQSGPATLDSQKDKICRCNKMTWLWNCRYWFDASCDPQYCNGSCKEKEKDK